MAHTYHWRPTARQLGSLVLLGAAVMLASANALAQNQDGTKPQQPQVQEPYSVPDPLEPSDQTSPQQGSSVVQPQPAATPDPSSDSSGSQDSGAPVYSLQTGLPLTARISPLRWGHLSLLSANLLEAYEAGDQLPSSTATLASGLIIYSIEHSRARFNFQYMPLIWYTSGTFQKNFTAHAVDVQLSRNLGRYWKLNFADQYHYSPNLSFMAGPSFNPDFNIGSSTRTPFLLSGRQAVVNTADLDLNRQLGRSDTLNLNLSNTFARLSGYRDSRTEPPLDIPSDEGLYYNGTLTWSHKFHRNGTFSLSYGYTNQQERNNDQRLQYQDVTAGYARALRPTVSLSIEAGPAWSKHSATAQGSIAIYKSFRRGGLAASFSRDTQFIGVLGGGFHNRYDVSASRRLWTRWDFQIGSSYVQQHLGNAVRSSDGIMSWAMASYRMTQTWSLYSSYYFFDFGAGVNSPTAREAAVLGIRWAWAPEIGRR